MRAAVGIAIALCLFAAPGPAAQPVLDVSGGQSFDLLRSGLVAGSDCGPVADQEILARLRDAAAARQDAGGSPPQEPCYHLYAVLDNPQPAPVRYVLRVRPEVIGPGRLLLAADGRAVMAGTYPPASSMEGLPSFLQIAPGANFVIEIPERTAYEILLGLRVDNLPGWHTVSLLPEPVFSAEHRWRMAFIFCLLAVLLILFLQTLIEGLSGQPAALWYSAHSLIALIFWSFTFGVAGMMAGWFDDGHRITRWAMVIGWAAILMFQREILELHIRHPWFARILTAAAIYVAAGALMHIWIAPRTGAAITIFFFMPFAIIATAAAILGVVSSAIGGRLLAAGWLLYLAGLYRGFVASVTGIGYRDEVITYAAAGAVAEALIFMLVLRFQAARTRADKIRTETENASWHRFIRTITHDLQQPLYALQLLQSGIKTRHAAPEAAAVNALAEMVEELLDAGKTEAGTAPLTLEPIDLSTLFASLASELRPEAESRGIAIRTVPCRQAGISHPLFLQRILRNLAINAVRHSGSRRILIGVRRRADVLRIVICDQGRGLDSHRLEDASTADPGGGGIGLSNVKRLAALLGHMIDVTSRAGRGTAAWIEIPRAGKAIIARAGTTSRHRRV